MARKPKRVAPPVIDVAPPQQERQPLVNISNVNVTCHDTAGEAASHLARALSKMADAAASLAARLELPTNVTGISISHVNDASIANATLTNRADENAHEE